MNQTYNVKQTCAKKAQLKLKLNSIRKRTKILLEKHNWKKFFGSNEDTCNLSWNVVKPQNLQFSDEDEHDYYDELSSTLIDYEEQQQKQIKKFEAVNTQERKMNEYQQMEIDCSFHTYQFTPVAVRTRKSTLSQKSFTFIGELASTSTPTSKKNEPITSTPNVSTHNPLNYHPTYTIRNKKMKTSTTRKTQTATTTTTRYNTCSCKCHDINCNCDYKRQKRKLAKRIKQQQQQMQQALKPTHVQISLQDLLYMPNKNASFLHQYQNGKIYYI